MWTRTTINQMDRCTFTLKTHAMIQPDGLTVDLWLILLLKRMGRCSHSTTDIWVTIGRHSNWNWFYSRIFCSTTMLSTMLQECFLWELGIFDGGTKLGRHCNIHTIHSIRSFCRLWYESDFMGLWIWWINGCMGAEKISGTDWWGSFHIRPNWYYENFHFFFKYLGLVIEWNIRH